MAKVLVVGSTGSLGKRALEKLKVDFEVIDLDLVGTSAGYQLDPDTLTISDWDNWTQDVATVYFLLGIENSNSYILSDTELDELSIIENSFSIFIRGKNSSATPINVVYISTDRVYLGDGFPDSRDTINIDNPGDDPELNSILRYTSLKRTTEINLLLTDNKFLRVIRPFSIVAPEQASDWPLSKYIINASRDFDLESFGGGNRGLAFTHVNDLINTVVSDLFSTEITPGSVILNVCRARNYLPEYFLIEKIKNKLESGSIINYGSITDNFKLVQKTPVTEDSELYNTPAITIEQIIEELKYAVDPVQRYQPLVVTSAIYDPNYYLTIAGTAEPLSTIAIQLGSGISLSTDTDASGFWSATTPDPHEYPDELEIYVFATTSEKAQYDTVLYVVPAST
jgi:nucleoside-diphosphate-sugar epimerase